MTKASILSRDEVEKLIADALETQKKSHAAEMSSRDALLARLTAAVNAMTAAGASPNKPDFVPLKRASGDAGVSYENARKWCALGKVVARREGKLWFVERESFAEYAAMRRKG